jgi:hypothetical protein
VCAAVRRPQVHLITAKPDKWVSRNPAGTIQALNRSSSVVCSENIYNWGAERLTLLVLIESGDAGRLDKACPRVLSRGGA